MIDKPSIKKAAVVAFAIAFAQLTTAQIIKTKLDVVAGASAREYLHAGLRYQYSDVTQLGLFIGGDLGLQDEIINTYSLDHMIHFGKLNYYSNRPVWYARQGFTYSVNYFESSKKRKYSYLNLSLGRELQVNDWLGFNVDAGLIVQVRQYKDEKPALETPIDNVWYYLPLFRFQTFISF